MTPKHNMKPINDKCQEKYLNVGLKFGAPVTLNENAVKLHSAYEIKKKLVMTGAKISKFPTSTQHCAIAPVKNTARLGSSPCTVPLPKYANPGNKLSRAIACKTRLPPNKLPNALESALINIPATTKYGDIKAESCITVIEDRKVLRLKPDASVSISIKYVRMAANTANIVPLGIALDGFFIVMEKVLQKIIFKMRLKK